MLDTVEEAVSALTELYGLKSEEARKALIIGQAFEEAWAIYENGQEDAVTEMARMRLELNALRGRLHEPVNDRLQGETVYGEMDDLEKQHWIWTRVQDGRTDLSLWPTVPSINFEDARYWVGHQRANGSKSNLSHYRTSADLLNLLSYLKGEPANE